MKLNVVSTSDIIGGWLEDLQSGQPPAKFAMAPPFVSMGFRPGMMSVFAGQPGAGKTAAILQITTELLRMNSAANVLIANVEMSPVVLLERIVSRLSGVPLQDLTDRTLTEEQMQRVRVGVGSLRGVASRLSFLREPFTLEHLALAADSVKANIMIVDYLQRFSLDSERLEERAALNAMMDKLRTFCGDDALILAVSALARGSSQNGATYSNAGMASLRGSSELEYGADSVYILQASEDGTGVTFSNPKQRYGQCQDISTTFNGAVQSFTPFDSLAAFENSTPVASKRRGA